MGGSTTNQLKMDPETDAGSVGLLDMLTLNIWCEMCTTSGLNVLTNPKSLDLQVFVGKASA